MDATIQENTITTFATMATESIEEEEKLFNNPETEKLDQISVCKCLLDDDSSEKVEISARKRQILTTVARTESYLQERRIPELIRFLLTKVIAQASKKPVAYMEKLLNDCMLFRAGHGAPPVLYEHRLVKASRRLELAPAAGCCSYFCSYRCRYISNIVGMYGNIVGGFISIIYYQTSH